MGGDIRGWGTMDEGVPEDRWAGSRRWEEDPAVMSDPKPIPQEAQSSSAPQMHHVCLALHHLQRWHRIK